MSHSKKIIAAARREYGNCELLEATVSPDPFVQFEHWFQDALNANMVDPNAMTVATVDANGLPDVRVLLLKEFDKNGFVFFTHYRSPKAIQAEKSGHIALNFYWNTFARQVKIKGTIARVSRQESEDYFASRPRNSQICTAASDQSNVITNREALENKVKAAFDYFEGKPVPCPTDWGGYRVTPYEFEFFQGRDNRLNDRLRYTKTNNAWQIERLSP